MENGIFHLGNPTVAGETLAASVSFVHLRPWKMALTAAPQRGTALTFFAKLKSKARNCFLFQEERDLQVKRHQPSKVPLLKAALFERRRFERLTFQILKDCLKAFLRTIIPIAKRAQISVGH